jgi:hypothetical protein
MNGLNHCRIVSRFSATPPWLAGFRGDGSPWLERHGNHHRSLRDWSGAQLRQLVRSWTNPLSLVKTLCDVEVNRLGLSVGGGKSD